VRRLTHSCRLLLTLGRVEGVLKVGNLGYARQEDEDALPRAGRVRHQQQDDLPHRRRDLPATTMAHPQPCDTAHCRHHPPPAAAAVAASATAGAAAATTAHLGPY
jgi:hypothetical protein